MVRVAEVASALSAFSGLRLLLLVYTRENRAAAGTCAPLSDLPSQFIAVYESAASKEKWSRLSAL